jgi:Concanavalin A-like lectin/glucanases superfamily
MGVPTPTGTLQGVAAFSWDGSAWQPSGRAGPGVGTPTGVLRGVAPFSWDGAAWQPSGRAGPGVATPTGVLDGVAVYNWSGSAWVPAGGQPTPSTPSGALRGVAAFTWDGAAWQPAGQAGPDVATPYGVLDGVALFNWTGSAWAAVQGPTLDLVFSGPTLDPRLTFTRASTATYFNAAGVMQTAATNAPRFDYDPVTHVLRGLLIEEQRTNLMLQSADVSNATVWQDAGIAPAAAPVVTANQMASPDGTMTAARVAFPAVSVANSGSVIAQPFTATAAQYSCSVWLKGSVGGEQIYIMMYGVSALLCTLTTSWQRFTLSLPALTATTWFFQIGVDLRDGAQTSKPACTIYVWGAQVELGAFATSYIPTTAAAVTRALEDCWMSTGAWFNAAASTLFGEFIYPRQIDPTEAHDLVTIGDNTGAAGNYFTVRATDGGATGPLLSKVNTSTTTLAPPGNPVVGAVSKLVGALDGTTSYACLNGGAVGTLAAPTPMGLVRLILGNHNTGGIVSPLNGYIRRVRYWPRALSGSELQSVTT